MNALIILYNGPKIEDPTVDHVVTQMVTDGVNSEDVDVYSIDQTDIVRVLTQEVIRKNCTNEQRFVIAPEVETPLHHACVYLRGIFGADVEKGSPNVIRFITTCLARLQDGDERLRNALDIIVTNSRKDAEAEGLPQVIYKAIVHLSTSNLI